MGHQRKEIVRSVLSHAQFPCLLIQLPIHPSALGLSFLAKRLLFEVPGEIFMTTFSGEDGSMPHFMEETTEDQEGTWKWPKVSLGMVESGFETKPA